VGAAPGHTPNGTHAEALEKYCGILGGLETELKIIKSVLGVILSIISFAFRFIIIRVVHSIGMKTISGEIAQFKNAVFIVSFVNNGLLIMLMSANFEAIPLTHNGRYSDFNFDWF